MSTRTALPADQTQRSELKPGPVTAVSGEVEEVHNLQDAQNALMKMLYGSENKKVDEFFETLERKFGAKREQLAYGAIGFVSVYLVIGSFAQLLCNFIGFGYPCYASTKAIRSEDKADDTLWLTYWTVFAAFSLVDFFAENIMAWLPIYWLAKTIFLLYLAMPQTKGAVKLYTKIVDPAVTQLDAYYSKHLDYDVQRNTNFVSYKNGTTPWTTKIAEHGYSARQISNAFAITNSTFIR